jgi:hypothetical protein
LPSAAVTDFTMRGMINLPPLAIVAIATVICKARHPNFVPHRNTGDGNLLQDCGGRMSPLISPGSSIPVRSPNRSVGCIVELLFPYTELRVWPLQCCSI